jgi:hypothetical protein
MFNPFVPFDNRLFLALIKAGHTHFVRQTYKRGMDHFDEGIRNAFLITHYNNINQAQIHFEALAKDGNRFLFDLSEAEHYKRLELASNGLPGFRVFSPILPGPWKPGEMVAIKLKKYIGQKLHWTPERGEQVKTDLFVQFGELFLTLKYRSHEVKLPFSDIEKS